MGKKLVILSLILILITSVFSVSVFATDDNESSGNGSYTVVMNAKNSKVTPGGEVLITVKISNLNVGNNGISQFRAQLGFDTDVFETLTESSIDGIDGWKPSYAVGTGKVQLYRDKPLTTDGEIMQISLKTKAGVADGTQGEVSITNIIASDSISEYNTSDVSTGITVTNTTSGIGGSENEVQNSAPIPLNFAVATPTTNEVENETENEVVNNTVNNTAVNNTSNRIEVVNEVDSDIPYTGSESGALIRIIIGVIFIALVMYIKIERMNKDIR